MPTLHYVEGLGGVYRQDEVVRDMSELEKQLAEAQDKVRWRKWEDEKPEAGKLILIRYQRFIGGWKHELGLMQAPLKKLITLLGDEIRNESSQWIPVPIDGEAKPIASDGDGMNFEVPSDTPSTGMAK